MMTEIVQIHRVGQREFQSVAAAVLRLCAPNDVLIETSCMHVCVCVCVCVCVEESVDQLTVGQQVDRCVVKVDRCDSDR